MCCFFTGNGQKHLVVTQQEMVTAEAGGSVTMSCVFTAMSPKYSATWTLGCSPDALPLQGLPCFQHRVNISTQDPVQTLYGLDVHSYEITTAMTIINLTENDSGTFYCHIKMADDKTGTGNGTRLEVTPRSRPADKEDQEKSPSILYAVVGAEACVIVILIAVVIRHRPRGMYES
ncbi:hypothetical protein PRIEUP_LOCUS1003, partial [Pristimantis euphronides]